MPRKSYPILLLLVLAFGLDTARAQQALRKEGNIWYFGSNAGIDFNTSPPTPLMNGALNTNEGCATICNKYGNLLLYTDGIRIYNKSHAIMPNGSGLTGNPSSTQSGIIVPNPDSAHIYYIFTTSGGGGTTAYSVVDTTLALGMGDVISKNILLLNNGGEKLTAVKHSNGKETWVITHQSNNNSFYAYRVGGAGVSSTPVVSSVGLNQSSLAIGYLKSSPDGQKLVGVEYFNKFAEIFDFNPATGVISNPQLLINTSSYYGAEFSPSGRYLYITTTTANPSVLLQFDMQAGSLANIIASMTQIMSFTTPQIPGALQLAPDGKIYLSMMNSSWLGVIMDPEKPGALCGFSANGFDISPKKCQYGLPSFNQSFFKQAIIDMETSSTSCGKLDFSLANIGDTGKLISSHWDFGDGTTDTGKRVNKVYAAHGTYTITNIIDVGGDRPFKDTLLREIKTIAPPNVGFTVNQLSQCISENSFIFKDTTVFAAGTGKAKSFWWFSDTLWVQANSINLNRKFYKEGTVSIKLKVTSTDNCTDTAEKIVTILPSANAGFAIADTVQCFKGNSFAPTQTSSIKLPESLSGFSWNFGDSTTSPSAAPTKTFADTGTYTIKMVAHASNGCNDTVTGRFKVLPSPAAGFTAPDVCFKDSMPFSNTTTLKKGTARYNWNYGNGFTDTVFQQNRLYKDTGTYTVSMYATTANGCSDSIFKKVKVMPKPVADFKTTGHCVSAPIDFTDISTRFGLPAQHNQWYFGDGADAQTPGGTQHIYTIKGLQDIKLVTLAANGCSDSITKQLYLHVVPSAGFKINKADQCLKDNEFSFSNESAIAEGSITNYQWTVDNTSLSTQTTAAFSAVLPGSYTTKLKITSAQGCADSISKTLTVHPQTVVDVAVNDADQCLGANLFAFTNNSALSTGFFTSEWILSTPATYSTHTIPDQVFTVPGKYSVLYISTTGEGCKDSSEKILTVHLNPEVDFKTQPVCTNDSALFTNTTSSSGGGASQWLWLFGDGGTATDKEPFHRYTSAGYYKVTLIGVSTNGCSDTLVRDSAIRVVTAPTARFTMDEPDIYAHPITVKFTNLSINGTNFFWAFGNGNSNREENPTEKYYDTGKFVVSLAVSNDLNCFDNYDTTLYLAPVSDVYIPNAFTPNNDPLNGTFKITGVLYYRDFKMLVFDRWGKLMFYSNNPDYGWDGRYEGTNVAEGVYQYIIEFKPFDGKIKTHTGNFHLLR